ncbi:GntR family transcriptional regulator [Fusibacter sp. 3D3]|uniref:GntR family transcriptional regulator n=1 Tax=Fusibacter sp. 3D3 TaxID=1048380 RepID=UPI00085749E1|nr:GntR family transcriptional regulator [Fusibacter sp. 3D3]GAU75696.1 transcriptional regulator [Fusibacter sp. 3D3]
MQGDPLRRPSKAASVLSDDVYEILKQDILTLKVKPGQTLTEQEICDQFIISRTPSRDVLKRLRNEGLVVAIPYKAHYVALLNYDYIQQIIYMRHILEVNIVKDLLPIKHEQMICDLEFSLEQQAQLLKSNFLPEDFYQMDSQFHKIGFQYADKLAIWEQIQKSQIHYTRFRMLDILIDKNFDVLYEEHKQIVESIKSGHIEQLEKHFLKHLEGGISRLNEKVHNEYACYFEQPF